MPESPKLQPGRFQEAAVVRNVWAATTEIGTTKKHLLDPAYWANFANRLRPDDLIETRCEDGTYWGLYRVLTCDRTWAKVQCLIESAATTQDVSLTQDAQEPEYIVAWKGPMKKFCVIRTTDKQMIREGEQSRASAHGWLRDHLAVTA